MLRITPSIAKILVPQYTVVCLEAIDRAMNGSKSGAPRTYEFARCDTSRQERYRLITVLVKPLRCRRLTLV